MDKRRSFEEVTTGISEAEALEAASRCFRCGTTMPCVVFKPVDAKEMVIRWDARKALELWQKRQSQRDIPLPDVFTSVDQVLQAPRDIVGRNRLVLRARDSHELLYYTTDDE